MFCYSLVVVVEYLVVCYSLAAVVEYLVKCHLLITYIMNRVGGGD